MNKIIRNSGLSYSKIEFDEIFDYLTFFEDRFKDFLELSEYPSDMEVFVSTRDMIDIITRVDKRKAYYYCFHSMEINERKHVALYAYWILKFRPFTVTDIRYIDKKKENCINEAFAIYMICSILLYNDITIDTTFEKIFYKKLLYSFRYRGFSIESLMLLVEAITSETFNIEYNEIV